MSAVVERVASCMLCVCSVPFLLEYISMHPQRGARRTQLRFGQTREALQPRPVGNSFQSFRDQAYEYRRTSVLVKRAVVTALGPHAGLLIRGHVSPAVDSGLYMRVPRNCMVPSVSSIHRLPEDQLGAL